MNEYALLFCWLPLAIGVGLPVLYILGHLQAASRRAALEDAKKDARERALAIREEKAARDAALHEAKLAEVNNKVVLQDINREIAMLKEKELRFKTRHMSDQPFVPINHDPGA